MSPSPQIFKSVRPQSKDDIGIRDKERKESTDSMRGVPIPAVPSTPTRAGFPMRGLALQLPPRTTSPGPTQQSTATAASASGSGAAYITQAPLSPKLDHSHIYASPTTNILRPGMFMAREPIVGDESGDAWSARVEWCRLVAAREKSRPRDRRGRMFVVGEA